MAIGSGQQIQMTVGRSCRGPRRRSLIRKPRLLCFRLLLVTPNAGVGAFAPLIGLRADTFGVGNAMHALVLLLHVRLGHLATGRLPLHLLDHLVRLAHSLYMCSLEHLSLAQRGDHVSTFRDRCGG